LPLENKNTVEEINATEKRFWTYIDDFKKDVVENKPA
jgi:hypothetical protein